MAVFELCVITEFDCIAMYIWSQRFKLLFSDLQRGGLVPRGRHGRPVYRRDPRKPEVHELSVRLQQNWSGTLFYVSLHHQWTTNLILMFQILKYLCLIRTTLVRRKSDISNQIINVTGGLFTYLISFCGLYYDYIKRADLSIYMWRAL